MLRGTSLRSKIRLQSNTGQSLYSVFINGDTPYPGRRLEVLNKLLMNFAEREDGARLPEENWKPRRSTRIYPVS